MALLLGPGVEVCDWHSRHDVFRAAEGNGASRHRHQWRADGAEPAALPPLDGGRIMVSLLPPRAAWKFAQLERWGFPILLALLFRVAG
jgi:hypothetical protein